jgi:predicted lipoprotein
MAKGIKYAITIVVIIFIAYNSVYFKNLSEVKATAKTFDAAAYAQNLLNKQLPDVETKAPDIDEVLARLKTDRSKVLEKYGKALAIGNTRYLLVKGKGNITNIEESDVQLTTSAKNDLQIATEYIFGNTVRDASGLVNLNDFSNTLDLNNISSEVNKIIRNKIVPPFRQTVKQGNEVEFMGAITLNSEYLNTDDLEVIPVSLKIVK